MSGAVPIEPAVAPAAARSGLAESAAAPSPSWRVRAATHGDIVPAAAAVRELLCELGGSPPAVPAMEGAARALVGDPRAGVLLVADAAGELVGVLGASWQLALHVPGRYGLIQDLWVDPAWRAQRIGGGLLAALLERTRELGIERIEVGLPRAGYPGLAATQAFYGANGFEALGARMRRVTR
jgi:GNAT superfamily N-acetyltransferase